MEKVGGGGGGSGGGAMFILFLCVWFLKPKIRNKLKIFIWNQATTKKQNKTKKPQKPNN